MIGCGSRVENNVDPGKKNRISTKFNPTTKISFGC